MTRPQMIRADTLDLQDHETPSAKDHTKQPEHPTPLGGGRPAPHQELSIRHADQDTKSEISNGPGADGSHEYQNGDMYDDPEEIDGDVGRNGHYDHEDGDLADGESDDLLDDDLMDKISSSPSIDDEDIDFEFVYALHNFVATVDGQANAAKGDTMVLLDDSNSYWWLVRVVKDGSIGYLPAEHIETPTERLARLNKHRNVDLSATMLGDNSEKSKNPLKKAMRRRNAKTVNFAAPTYIEASDVEYSTDEEDEHGDFFNDDETVESEDGDAQEQNEDIVVEPLRPKVQKDKPTEQAEGASSPEKQESDRAISDPRRSSEEFFDPEEPTVSRSRNGTVRNTDSFFKDDTAEPKKISLTPNLLRDESSSTTLTNDWKDGRGSFESIDKATGSQDKVKDDKKRKDKKPGMLSGLFKRKDKKTRSADDDFEEAEKSPAESAFRASPQPKASLESVSPEQPRTVKPQRQTSNKLQKQPPTTASPTATKTDGSSDSVNADLIMEREITVRSQSEQSIRRVTSQDTESIGDGAVASPVGQLNPSKDSFASVGSRDPFASPDEQLSSEAQWRGPYDSSEKISNVQPSVMSPPQRFNPKVVTDHYDRASVSPIDFDQEGDHIPIAAPGLTKETIQRAQSISPPSSPSSPDTDANYMKGGSEATPGSLDTLSVDTPTWSDASLRSYMDEENDIRDLFIIVHDKSNIPPAGPEHPVTGRLFKEESKRLKEMNNQLDEMLVSWMSQRTKHSSTIQNMQSPTS
ncbi:hypothetical protein N7462_005537 [Penicillium macrosclerotiorum]|uniref:uncharacterized protein n=1 Tax=Penicillium macrosclerotiorum TaxID=303699 RepID=UPI002547E326|nr:uncharacterized protein N7462_005537 [Penicillium macrosclerotiorum]KAJ5682372.1 hypothetical protein N7462_005537 [Penicillium macrosclerotiorum]